MLAQRAARQPRRACAFCNTGRRPGRAGLRRPLARRSTTRAASIARAPPVRGGRCSSRRRPRAPRLPRGCATRASARPARERAAEVARLARARALERGRGRRSAEVGGAGRRRCSTRRRGLRGARARHCATTSTRTASSAWCSGCRAASTRRSSRCVAVDALGAERVTCVDHAVALLLGGDAAPTPRRWRRNLGIELLELPIADADARAYERAAAPSRSPAASPT